MKKGIVLLTLALVLLRFLTACSAGPQAGAAENTVQQEQTEGSETMKAFTREELAQYNGKNGNPAYIAVDGKVYDVTNAPPWNGGKHNGYEAGKDLTEEIKSKSPHGVSKLKGIPVVGTLAD